MNSETYMHSPALDMVNIWEHKKWHKITSQLRIKALTCEVLCEVIIRRNTLLAYLHQTLNAYLSLRKKKRIKIDLTPLATVHLHTNVISMSNFSFFISRCMLLKFLVNTVRNLSEIKIIFHLKSILAGKQWLICTFLVCWLENSYKQNWLIFLRKLSTTRRNATSKKLMTMGNLLIWRICWCARAYWFFINY